MVLGSASLDGRLDVPIINGFVPQLGNSITFLTTTGTVSGEFAAVFSPNLGTANPNLSIEVQYNTASTQLNFVSPLTNIAYQPSQSVTEWSDAQNTWVTNMSPEVPGIRHVIEVQNSSGSDRELNVQTADAFVHGLEIDGGTHTMTLVVKNGRSLSAIVGTTIEDQAVIELGDGSTQGNLVSSTVNVRGGGLLAGNGTVIGNLVVGAGPARRGDAAARLFGRPPRRRRRLPARRQGHDAHRSQRQHRRPVRHDRRDGRSDLGRQAGRRCLGLHRRDGRARR